jgi:hypothetical protein
MPEGANTRGTLQGTHALPCLGLPLFQVLVRTNLTQADTQLLDTGRFRWLAYRVSIAPCAVSLCFAKNQMILLANLHMVCCNLCRRSARRSAAG